METQNYLRIKEILSEKNVARKDLSEKLGISIVHMNNIVNGKSIPSMDKLMKISQILDVDFRELFISTKQSINMSDIQEAQRLIKTGLDLLNRNCQ
jgi:transcriptional regulator with XRE-family HTH domain